MYHKRKNPGLRCRGRLPELRRENAALRTYRDLVERIDTILIRWDSRGSILFINGKGLDFFGYAAEEMSGMSIMDLLPPVDNPEATLDALISGMLRKSSLSMSGEYLAKTKSGEWRKVFWINRLVPDDRGEPSEILSAIIERTAIRDMRNLPPEVGYFFKQLVDTIPSPVYYKDPEGRYLGCNRAFQKLMGVPRDKIVGRTAYDLVPRDFAEIYEQQDRHLIQHPGTQFFEAPVRDHETGDRLFLFNKATFSSFTGEVLGISGVMTDITDRKLMELALASSEERLKIIIEKLPIAVICIDAETHVVALANPIALSMIGLPREECVGMVCHHRICHTRSGDCPVTDRGETLHQAERVLLAADGREIPIVKTVVPIEMKGRPYLLECIIDVSRAKEAVETHIRAEKLKSVVELAGAASHELAQPLQVISGYLEILSSGMIADPEKQDILCETMRAEVRRMADILINLTHITRYETKPYAGNDTIFDIHGAAAERPDDRDHS